MEERTHQIVATAALQETGTLHLPTPTYREEEKEREGEADCTYHGARTGKQGKLSRFQPEGVDRYYIIPAT